MFTGIVEAALPVRSAQRHEGLLRLAIDLSCLDESGGLRNGDSVAINGCCLTVAALDGSVATFEAVPQTQSLTNLGELKAGARVNIERAVKAGGRFDGHFVQGHVDSTGVVAALKEQDGELRVTVDCGPEFAAQCIPRGSVCVDGVSLTIAELDASSFTLAVIPHTRKVTSIGDWRVGTRVNLEADMVGKYVRRAMGRAPASSIDEELLRRTGFAP